MDSAFIARGIVAALCVQCLGCGAGSAIHETGLSPRFSVVNRSPRTYHTGEKVVLRIELINESTRDLFVREWPDRVTYRYDLQAESADTLAGGAGTSAFSLTHQPRYTRVRGCDQCERTGDTVEWKGKGCAILVVESEIGPFETPGTLQVKISIPTTSCFLWGGTETCPIEFEEEFAIFVSQE